METIGQRAVDVGSAVAAGAALVIYSVEASAPALAALTTLMAFLWWLRKWALQVRRWWRDRKGART